MKAKLKFKLDILCVGRIRENALVRSVEQEDESNDGMSSAGVVALRE